MKKYIKWCTGHYRIDFCNEVKKQLREKGFTCITRDYSKEHGVSYARVYIEMNDFYHEHNDEIKIDVREGSK